MYVAHQECIRRYALEDAHQLCSFHSFYNYVHFCYFVDGVDVNGTYPIHNLCSLVMYMYGHGDVHIV